MQPLVAGVDCHAESHTVVVVDGLGRTVGELVVRSELAAFADAREQIEQWAGAREAGAVVWGLESTGSYGRGFAEFLVASGDVVYEVPPRLGHAERKRARRLGKSDALDAHAIATVVLREGARLTRFYGERMEEELRLYYDHRDRLVRERTALINRVRHAARRLGITDVPLDLTSASGLERVMTLLAAHAAPSAIALAVRTELDFTCTRLRLLGEQIAELERRLRPLVKPWRALMALVGVSDRVAAGLIGHAGDLRNVRNAAAFAMRSGAAPVVCSSGRNHHVRVNHAGDRQLNRLLHIIALVQRRTPDHVGQHYYARKLAEGKTPRAAMRCLKRRLATIVYYRLLEDAERLQHLPAASAAAA